MILDLISKYYGIDLLAMALSFVGIYTIGNRKRYGFVIAMAGNILWLVLGLLTKSTGLMLANFVLAMLYIRAFVLWNNQK